MGTIVEAERPVIDYCICRDNGDLTKHGSNGSEGFSRQDLLMN